MVKNYGIFVFVASMLVGLVGFGISALIGILFPSTQCAVRYLATSFALLFVLGVMVATVTTLHKSR